MMKIEENEIDRLARCDCHTHPGYSIDAKGTIEQFILAAVERKLQKICFTTHIDLDPNRSAVDKFIRYNGRLYVLDSSIVHHYIDDIAGARKKFGDRIEIIYGFEFSYEPHYKNLIEQFIAEFEPEFAIGSVHSIDSFEITAHKSIDIVTRIFEPFRFVERYYDFVLSLARSGLFDVIGHIDGFKKYLSRYWGLSNLEQIEMEILPAIAHKIAETDTKFEINSSAFRKGFPAPYPSAKTIEILLDADVPLGSFGSDAHRPEDVGSLIQNAANYLKGII
ncbi:histidinol-phosphatase HisJ family protein [bacterium]|nr:histidinol-phosphatase HisJ family protein [bacterium]